MGKIEVICRKCGRKAPADDFRVDHIYKLAVCKVCYTDRKKDLPKKPEEKTVRELMQEPRQELKSIQYEIKKSRIFDENDDDYLEKAVKKKQEEILKRKENVIRVRPIKDNKALYPCQHCKYKFKYNLETKKPTQCPFCGRKVDHNVAF